MEKKAGPRTHGRRKIVALAVLNIAAAAAVGITTGVFYKFFIDRDCEELQDRIMAAVETVDARVGVAVVFDDGDTLGVVSDGGSRFPMMSVMKFHQALAVCQWLRDSETSLDAAVAVSGSQLEKDTYSPLRDRFPDGGVFSFRELLEYTLVYSDNNACDVLFDAVGGPGYVDGYVRSLGADGFSVECTEAEMHSDFDNCFRNWSTPLSAALLCDWFYRNREADAYSGYIWRTMSECRTGSVRIPGKIAEEAAVIAHKTGTGDVGADGRIMAVNDAGVVVLPDGRHFSMAVFIEDASCSMDECEALIADVAGMVFDHVSRKNLR